MLNIDSTGYILIHSGEGERMVLACVMTGVYIILICRHLNVIPPVSFGRPWSLNLIAVFRLDLFILLADSASLADHCLTGTVDGKIMVLLAF